ncbi:MAG: bile acid:sodium symporter family protein [Atopobiaceae bacterium]|nr:bile acid:sodium symporter family protein [Atopobiaceae bacterium]
MEHRGYETWLALGDWIGSHLTLIVPAGVAIGMLCPRALLPIKPAIPTLFAIMTFQNSLKNDPSSLRRVLHRPGVLAAILAWVHVVAPLITWAIASAVFGPNSNTVAGVVLEYAVPIGASTVMWVGMFEGEIALALSALLASTLVSPFSIPLTLKLLVGATIAFDSAQMMASMAYMVAIPALAATVAYVLTRGQSARLHRPTVPVSRLLLPVIVATNATGLADYVRRPSLHLFQILVLMLAFAIASFVVGMLLARRLSGDKRDRFVATSFCCGIRNVSVGAVLASSYFSPEVMFPAIIGTPFQQVLAALFGRMMQHVLEMEAPTDSPAGIIPR